MAASRFSRDSLTLFGRAIPSNRLMPAPMEKLVFVVVAPVV